MKLLEAITWLAVLLTTVLVADSVRNRNPRPAPRASCATLLSASRTSADTLYVYVSRGDCAQ